jgi:hypothetical protein
MTSTLRERFSIAEIDALLVEGSSWTLEQARDAHFSLQASRLRQ